MTNPLPLITPAPQSTESILSGPSAVFSEGKTLELFIAVRRALSHQPFETDDLIGALDALWLHLQQQDPVARLHEMIISKSSHYGDMDLASFILIQANPTLGTDHRITLFKHLQGMGYDFNLGQPLNPSLSPEGMNLRAAPLHYAVKYRFDTVVEFLTQEGNAQIDLPGKRGYTALFEAWNNGYSEKTLAALIRAGANVNHQGNEFQFTPLHFAVLQGSLSMIQTLVQAGARLNLVDHRDQHALFDAVKSMDLQIIEYLIEAGSDPTLRDYQGERVSDLSILRRDKSPNGRAVEKYLKGVTQAYEERQLLEQEFRTASMTSASHPQSSALTATSSGQRLDKSGEDESPSLEGTSKPRLKAL